MVGEEGQQGLAAGLGVVAVGPVGVHKLDGLSEDVLALRISVQVVHKAGHSVVKVIGLDPVLIVHDQLHELQPLALVHPQHDVIIQEFT